MAVMAVPMMPRVASAIVTGDMCAAVAVMALSCELAGPAAHG